MASAYVSFLKPKNNTIITQHNKANGLHLYSSRSSTLKCPKPSKEVFYQKKNFTNQNKTKNIDSTQNLISHRSKTENDENSNGVHQKSKSNNFIIKSKARTNESLYSPKEKIMESQRGQCWENPLKELDLVGFREELLMNLMNFDNLKNKNIDFEVLLEDNPEYFNHLLGICACFKCVCGLCKCKYALQNNSSCKYNLKNKNTTYSMDFVKSGEDFSPKTEKIHYFKDNILKSPALDCLTTNKIEYRPFSKSYTVRHKNIEKPLQDTPLFSLTQYKSEYPDWRTAGRLVINNRNQSETLLKDLPFISNTTYGDSFGTATNKGLSNIVKKSQKKKNSSPFFKCLPFFGETTSQAAFQNYLDSSKVLNNIPDFKTLYASSPEGLYNGCPTTLGQFDSTMSKSFRGVETRICPAKLVSNGKEEMKKNLYQKLKEINQKFIESRVSTVRIGG